MLKFGELRAARLWGSGFVGSAAAAARCRDHVLKCGLPGFGALGKKTMSPGGGFRLFGAWAQELRDFSWSLSYVCISYVFILLACFFGCFSSTVRVLVCLLSD